SLWYAWSVKHLLKNGCFWECKPSANQSWNFNKLIHLQVLARGFHRKQVGNGSDTWFWYDHWLSLGPLIAVSGGSGPSLAHIPKSAKVIDATSGNHWNLSPARGAGLETIQATLITTDPPHPEKGEDLNLWRDHRGQFKASFSSSTTWKQLRTPKQKVLWYDLIWFKLAIPRYSIVQWQAITHRLPTKDRLRGWGLQVDSACVLCNADQESHPHLFFACPFSSALWKHYAARCWPLPLEDLLVCSPWMISQSDMSHNRYQIARLIAQVIVYEVWRERNLRIFEGRRRTLHELRIHIEHLIRDNILSTQKG
ncbi:PREDICTED: uncharacterized protein LOC104799997, partial [Tarenaya hassleriana]|uniref:uncharacterized protein LOC104799997 n=1 Tax=Tarenaya hassleriana TaxID=28532 RepID=UPI00053C2C5E